MVLVIIKTLARVRQRGANYFHWQPHHALIIRTGNTVTRLSSSGQSRANRRSARDSMGYSFFPKTLDEIDDTIAPLCLLCRMNNIGQPEVQSLYFKLNVTLSSYLLSSIK